MPLTADIELRQLAQQSVPGPIDDVAEVDALRKCEICLAFYSLSDPLTLTCRRHKGRFRHAQAIVVIDRHAITSHVPQI